MNYNIFNRIVNRIRFRKQISYDESINVVDSIVKAKKLFKELSSLAHPDKNPDNLEVAENLMKHIVANRNNYEELLKLKKEVNDKLNK